MTHETMWVIRAYDSRDELVAQHDLTTATSKKVVEILSMVPTQFGSTPLGGPRLDRLAHAFGFPVVADAEHFLDFDADREPVVSEPSVADAAVFA